MSSILSYVPGANTLLGLSGRAQKVRVKSVDIHQIETNPDKRARSLKHLLKANHVNHAILFNNLRFDNHCAHILSSAYLLGATDNQLKDIYEEQTKELDPWEASPAEVIEEDWRDFLGDKRYQRAFVDFFEDQLVEPFSYDWKQLLSHFLFSGKEPLFHSLIGGLGHPLIHLGYAYEMDSKELAMEALGLTCVQHNFLHRYLDEAQFTTSSPMSMASPIDLLTKLSKDKRFDDITSDTTFSELESVFDSHGSVIMEYWNGWEITDATKQFELSQEAAVAMFAATVRPGTHAYDFFIVHVLTTSHAVRILLPLIPTEHHITLVRQWWLLALAVFILQGRPMPDSSNISDDLKGRRWSYVEDKALNSPWSKDAHYVKAIRALKEAANTWGDVHDRYLLAALTFVDNFDGWKF